MNFSFLAWTKPRTVAVTVQTFKTAKTDLEKLRDAKHQQLADELGKPWPPVLIQLERDLPDAFDAEIAATLNDPMLGLAH